MYVCGPVGTGKTAAVDDVVSRLCKHHVSAPRPPAAKRARTAQEAGSELTEELQQQEVDVARMDCVADAAAESAESVCVWLAAKLTGRSAEHTRAKYSTGAHLRRCIEAYVRARARPLVVVLDELDDLLDVPGGAALVQQLFEWSAAPASMLVLVGIGNNMQLAEHVAAHHASVLARRRTRASSVAVAAHSLKKRALAEEESPPWLPRVLRFRAYGQAEVAAILSTRVGAYGVLAPAALQLVAMRTETMGGDLRMALTMCREPLLRAYMQMARTGELPPLPLGAAAVAPVVAELVDDTRSVISGLTALQKQFLAALYLACVQAGAAAEAAEQAAADKRAQPRRRTTVAPPPQPPIATEAQAQERGTGTPPLGVRLAPARKTAVYEHYTQLCSALSAGAPCLSMLVLFRECVGALCDLNFVQAAGPDALYLTVDTDDLFAALHTTDPLIHRALAQLAQ